MIFGVSDVIWYIKVGVGCWFHSWLIEAETPSESGAKSCGKVETLLMTSSRLTIQTCSNQPLLWYRAVSEEVFAEQYKLLG